MTSEYKEVATKSLPVPSVILSTVLFPIAGLSSWWILNPREEAIVLHYGTLTAHVKKPGVHFNTVFGREIKTISTAQRAMVLPTLKITDKVGNPILVSVVITCRIVDPKKALLNVASPFEFVETQTTSVLKEVVSEFTYDELKSEGEAIGIRLLKMLQPKVDIAGVLVQACSINELNYSSDISKAMLKKQQAIALVEARNLLVQGSVEIAKHTVDKLRDNGIEMDQKEKARLVRSMVVVCTSDTHALPTLQL